MAVSSRMDLGFPIADGAEDKMNEYTSGSGDSGEHNGVLFGGNGVHLRGWPAIGGVGKDLAGGLR